MIFVYLLFLDSLLTNHETVAVDSKPEDTVGCGNTNHCVCNFYINPTKYEKHHITNKNRIKKNLI